MVGSARCLLLILYSPLDDAEFAYSLGELH
jgi:hypothetical protein